MNKDRYVSQFYNNPWYIYNGSKISGPTDFSSVVKLFNSDPKACDYFLCQKGMSAWQKIKDTIELHNLLQSSSMDEEKKAFTISVEQQLTKINSHINSPVKPKTHPVLHNNNSVSSSFQTEFNQVIKDLKEEALNYTSDKFPSTPTITTDIPLESKLEPKSNPLSSSVNNGTGTNTKNQSRTPASSTKSKTINTSISEPVSIPVRVSSSVINDISPSNNTNPKEKSCVTNQSSNNTSISTYSQAESKLKVPITIGRKIQTHVESRSTKLNVDTPQETTITVIQPRINSLDSSYTSEQTSATSKVHTFHKISSKNRTFRKSLTVPPPSNEMLALLTSNRLRLGQKTSLFTSSVFYPVCSLGLYYVLWLIKTYQLVTRHLAIGFSPIFLLSCIPGIHFLGCTYLLCLYDRMCYEDLNRSLPNQKRPKTHLFLNFFRSLFLAWCPSLFIAYFQNKLNNHWSTHEKYQI